MLELEDRHLKLIEILTCKTLQLFHQALRYVLEFYKEKKRRVEIKERKEREERKKYNFVSCSRVRRKRIEDPAVKMDEEMIALHNIMPVELAIKREMEYRTKVEVLKNRHLINLNPLLPSQVQPTSHTTSKRKEPSSSGTSLERQSMGLVCKICQITFSTVNHLKQHSNTIKHKGNVVQLKKRGQNVSTPFLCELCNSSCSSGIIMDEHLKGTRHLTLLQEFENAKRARAE
ncbi:hypothetical protein R6Q59_005448 [Mikania micrantha]|uniref:C2H2-type domain-containing protein n=1 Tax=Mikania micrantha TaxID=192012 RepID=A0A5N6Q2I2_9ASTR|nr:hypothetical protein E3N88_01925 [Mikania micrantha]